MRDNYAGREQTGVKHFILEHYLEALVFKVLHFSDITYVDGFSGPWKAQAVDFADTSFMIALRVLKNAQAKLSGKDGRPRHIRCFFSETKPRAFGLLKNAVAPFNKPEERFEVKAFCGSFEDAISEINTYTRGSFKLIFIDPTGWTGYSFDKIKPLFQGKSEVMINFMYEFVNRAASMSDRKTIDSLAPILGGSDWQERLDSSLPFAAVVDKLLQAYMVRETDVKDICVALANEGVVRKTWGGRQRKPEDDDLIGLVVTPRT